MFLFVNTDGYSLLCNFSSREDLEDAKATGDYSRLQEYYESTFGSLIDICATFKVREVSSETIQN